MTKYFDEDDSTLVELTLLGNEAAYEELVVRYEKAVKGTALKITRNEYSAQDAAQDAFVSAWMNLSSLRDFDCFKPWVCTITKNCARNLNIHYRSMVEEIGFDAFENIDLSDSDENGAMSMLTCEEKYAELHDMVESLSTKICEVITLHYFEGLSVKEISEHLSLPEGTVKWRLSEGRKQLRKGYGVMEKSYDEDEQIAVRVMRQVEELELWRLKNDKTGFENDYEYVLAEIEKFNDPKLKNYALADVLRLGYWWLPGKRNDEVVDRIKRAAEESHNDNVMQFLMDVDIRKIAARDRIEYMLNKQIPYLEQNGYKKSLGYLHFWLGFEYHKAKRYEDEIAEYRKVKELLNPMDAFYAAAVAGIHIIESKIDELKKNTNEYNIIVTGGTFRYIGNKLCFFAQPGFSTNADLSIGESLFYNSSRCDGIIYDPDLKEGEVRLASDNKTTLKFSQSSVTVETPAGVFDGCLEYIVENAYHGSGCVKTYFCPNIGIVRQKLTDHSNEYEWVLSSYTIKGGRGIVPFQQGNSWQYECRTPPKDIKSRMENAFEVTGYENGKVTVAHSGFAINEGYSDTFEGNMRKAISEYFDMNSEKLTDIEPVLQRAKELVTTKRQMRYCDIASAVMRRIFLTDPEYNPAYTEKGRWNFFKIIDVISKEENGEASVLCIDGNGANSFELKDMRNCDINGIKVLYNFLYEILYDNVGMIWSDKWMPGFSMSKTKAIWGMNINVDFNVLDTDTVTVPAGTFDNCRHIHFEVSGWSGGLRYRGGKFDYWYANRIGIVKMLHYLSESDTDCIWQLTDYKGTGAGFFPTDDGLFRRYEPQKLGNGWHGSVEYTFDTDETGTVIFKNALGTQDRTNYEADMAK